MWPLNLLIEHSGDKKMMGRKQALRVLSRAALNWEVALRNAAENRASSEEEEGDEVPTWINKDIAEIQEALVVVRKQL
jgi:hypothetical protein